MRMCGPVLLAAATTLPHHPAMADGPPVIDWQAAIAGFSEGEQRVAMVFTKKDAARCTGRWKLHADAVDEYAFPDTAEAVFIDQLRLPGAMQAIGFFQTEDPDHPAARLAAQEAERLLTLALGGDAAAARTYFENLGLCSTLPETLKDAPAETDFDEYVNKQKLGFVEMFVERLRARAPLTSLLMPEISFRYFVESDCAGHVTGSVENLSAADIDIGFMVEATYTRETPDCAAPLETAFLKWFHLEDATSHWDSILLAPDDHTFETFYVSQEGTAEYLLIRIEPHGKAYAISQIEYHRGAL